MNNSGYILVGEILLKKLNNVYLIKDVIWKLFILARKNTFHYILISFLILLSASINIVEAEAFRKILQGAVNSDLEELILGALLGLISVIVGSAISFVIGILKNLLNHRSIARLKKVIVNKILNMNYANYQKYHSADLIARINESAPNAQSSLNNELINFINNFTVLLFLIIYLFYLNWILALGILLLIIIVPILINPLASFLRGFYDDLQQRKANYEGFIEESVQGVEIVQVNSLQRLFSNKLQRQLYKYFKVNRKTVLLESVVNESHTLVYMISFVIILGIGGHMVFQGKLDIGSIAAFIVSFNKLLSPLSSFLDFWPRFQQSISSSRRFFEILDLPNEEDNISQDEVFIKRDSEACNKEVLSFKNVKFKYKHNASIDNVLNNISFSLIKNKINVLTGSSGSGKSTICNLILKFYEPDGGEIKLNGSSDYTIAEWRKQIGYVPQEAFIYSASVYENIVFGKPGIALNDVIQLTKKLNIHDRICKLSDGYQTILSENGDDLSGGEKQLICIARALIRKPQVLLLDEPTASLDTVNEAVVNQALKEITGYTTILIASHRKFILNEATQVFILKDGRLNTKRCMSI